MYAWVTMNESNHLYHCLGDCLKPDNDLFVRVLFFLAHRPKWKQGSWALYLLFWWIRLGSPQLNGVDYKPSYVQVT